MEFNQVRGFLAVAKTGSFSEAAKSLFLTQSAISVQVKKLEAELNVRLFDRAGRKIRVTAAGEQFQVHAEEIVRTVESATLGLAGAPHLQRGTLGLSAPPSVCSYFLPPVLKSFNDRYPHVKIALNPTISSSVVENVIWGTSDLGLTSLPCSNHRLVVEELLADPLLLAVHPAHALASRRIVGLEEVAPYPFISIDPHTAMGSWINTIFNASNLTLNVVLECRMFDVVKQLIRAKVGISILPRSVVLEESRSGTIRTLRLRDEETVRRIGLIWRQDKFLSAPFKVLVDLIRETARAATLRGGHDRKARQRKGARTISNSRPSAAVPPSSTRAPP